MANFSTPTIPAQTLPGQRHQGALAVITMLFFTWGLLTALNDILIPHLKEVYTLSYLQAMLVQFCFFGAYFLVSIPAGALVRRIGYQYGMVAGLATAAAGCALFYPAVHGGYAMFLLALFVLATGITILQVAVNPYVTVLGDPASASSRLTMTQAFNALGTTIAPLAGGMLILSGAVLSADELAALTPAALHDYHQAQRLVVQQPYLALCAALLALAVILALARLPRIEQHAGTQEGVAAALRRHPRLLLGGLAIFLYVGAEVSIGSFLINFLGAPQIAGLDSASAAHYVALYWGGAMVGRFAGAAAMRVVRPGIALAFNAACAALLIQVAVWQQGSVAMWAILAVGLCNSIMFPTVFSMALRGLGAATERGSGLLCMAIVGGAILPFAQGALADQAGVQHSFLLPAACYVYLLYFGWKYAEPESGR